MTIKIIGAILIIASCGGLGFSMCQNHRREEQAIEQLAQSLDWMVWELNYRMPPLAALCRGAAEAGRGAVSQVLQQLAYELDSQLTPDISACMTAAIAAVPRLPEKAAAHLKTVGTSLGRFDLQGQISALEMAAALCKRDLQHMSSGREIRMRNYQTLGLCTGAALVILFV